VPLEGEEKLSFLGFEVIMAGMLLVSGPFVYYRKRRTNLMQGAARIPTSPPRVLAQMIKLISFKLTWCIFLMVPFLCHCITVFTHVILEEAKCLLGLTGVENHSG